MGWIHSRLWGIVCGKAVPVLPEQGQKQPHLLKVHEFELTDTVSSPREVWRRHSPLPGWVQGSCGAHTNLRLLSLSLAGLRWQSGAAGGGGGGAGPGAAPAASASARGVLSWGELESRQGLCPWGLTQLLLRIRSASRFQIPLLG